MTSIEKKLLIAMACILALFIGSCVWLANSIESEFAGCKGLQGAVNRVWTGEPCETS